MNIYFASENNQKFEEMSQIFYPHSLVLPMHEGISFLPKETGRDFFSNALIKARYLYKQVKQTVIADDSGLCIDALDGNPGIFSARYGENEFGPLTAQEKNQLVLKKMKDKKNRSCRFICNMLILFDPYRYFSVQETLEGQIFTEERGNKGFGYDPIVWIPELHKTVAELSDEEKKLYSHRGKAGRSIKFFLDFNKKNIKEI